jgi:hypothetical protein
MVNIDTKEALAHIRWDVAQATHSLTAARAHAIAVNKTWASQVRLSRWLLARLLVLGLVLAIRLMRI